MRQYQPKYSIDDMDMPYVDICRRLKQANDLQFKLCIKLAAMKDPTAKQSSLEILREWDADVVIDEIDAYVAQLTETLLRCDGSASMRQHATAHRSFNSVEAISIDGAPEGMQVQAKEGLQHEPAPSTNVHKDFASQKTTPSNTEIMAEAPLPRVPNTMSSKTTLPNILIQRLCAVAVKDRR
jgi:hypothetical protein